jgi:phage gp29-like protein
MADITLYDAQGRPIERDVLTEELAAPVLAGIRTLWTNTVASGLTPQRLASILQRAVDNDALDYLVLAEEIEERDAHYRSVLSTRKLAVSGLEVTVEAASDDDADTRLADAVRELVRAPEFSEMVDDLLDALGKGYSVVELLWETSGKTWRPCYAWRDPRFFQFDLVSKSEVRMRDTADLVNGVELPPYKFIVHRPRLKTGIPIRGGLARMAAWAYLFKAYTLKDWMAFVEVYGIPMRLGRYGTGATDQDIKKLLSAVVNLGSDAAAVIHDSMKIEFQNAVQGTGNNDLFKAAAEWWDRQLSKLVLGQTASTEGTPGKLGNESAQDEVRQDLIKADAKHLGNTLNRDLVRPFVDLNFGPQAAYPRILLLVPDAEDLKLLTDALSKLVPLGLRVEQSVVRDKFALPDPAEDAEVLAPPAAPAPAFNRALRRATIVAENRARAHNAAAAFAPADTGFPDLDALMADALGDWEEQIDPVLEPLRQAVEDATSYDDLVKRLAELIGSMDVQALADALAKATFLGRVAGNVDAETGAVKPK